MKRLVFLFLLMASPAMAQRILIITGGTVTGNVTDSADFLVTLNQNVTGVTLTSTVTPATGYIVSMKFVQDATGSRTVVFGGNISTSCAVNSTANSVTICRWQYTASSNTWADAGGGAAANSPIPANQAQGPTYNVKNYGAKGDSQQVTGASNVAQGVDGCPAVPSTQCLDVPSAANNPFKQIDIGLVIYANDNPSSGINRMVPTTITGVTAGTGAHAGHQLISMASGTTGNCSGSCTVVWGTDDTAALIAAATAAYSATCPLTQDRANVFKPVCGSLYFPEGGYMTSGGGGALPGINKAFWASAAGSGTQALTGVYGAGQSKTTIYLRPDYNFGTLAANRGIFIAGGGEHVADLTITSSDFTYIMSTHPIVDLGGGTGYFENIRIVNTAISTNNNPIISIAGRGEVHNLTVQDPPLGFAAPLCQFNAVGIMDVYGFICSNGGVNLQVVNVTGGTSASHLTFHGGFVDEGGGLCPDGSTANTCIVNSQDVSFYGTILTSGAAANDYSISVDATSEVRCTGCGLLPFGANGGSAVNVASGGVFRASMSKFLAKGAGAWIWNCALVTSCIDNGGNNYSFISSATYSNAAAPMAALSHTWNTCYVTITPIVNATTYTMCNQFLDQGLNLIRVKASSQNVTTCATAPIITLTDGTATRTLTLTSGAATWDSGVIATSFASGGTMTVKYDVAAASACATPPTNLSVTYNMQSYGAP